MPIAKLSEALVLGEIDAAVLWEPWTSRLEDRFGSDLILLPGSDIYIEKMGSGLDPRFVAAA